MLLSSYGCSKLTKNADIMSCFIISSAPRKHVLEIFVFYCMRFQRYPKQNMSWGSAHRMFRLQCMHCVELLEYLKESEGQEFIYTEDLVHLCRQKSFVGKFEFPCDWLGGCFTWLCREFSWKPKPSTLLSEFMILCAEKLYIKFLL
jgi:hypothetical protein